MQQAVGTAAARSRPAELVGQVRHSGPRYVLEHRGQPAAILISMGEHEQLWGQTVARSGVQTPSSLSPESQRTQSCH